MKTKPVSKQMTRSVGRKEMIFGYLVGPFGAMLSQGIFTSILQNYFTDVLRLDLTFLTSLQLFSTILIVLANLMAGQLIERTRKTSGKARPYILLSAFLLSVSSVLMFVMPFQGTARMIWVAVAYNLYYSLAYPLYNTANSTLLAVSTRNSDDRGMMASLVNIAQLATMGAGSMVFPMLVSFSLKDRQERWMLVMAAIALFSTLTILMQYRFTRERITEEYQKKEQSETSSGETLSLTQQIRTVTRDREWWIIILFYLLFQTGGAMRNGSMTYFCKWVLDNSFLHNADAWGVSQSILSICGALPMAVAALLVVPLSRRFGKKNLVIVGCLISILGGVIAGLGAGNLIPVAAGIALKCLGSAPACYLILAILADVIDHIERKSGVRTDGLTMSFYSSIMVAATPVCNAILSAMLKAAGYNQNAPFSKGRMGQPASALTAISAAYIWIETAAYVVCVILMCFYHVEKEMKQEKGNQMVES